MATVKKEGSKVYIEGVPSIGWPHTNPEVAGNTYFPTALVSCMKVFGSLTNAKGLWLGEDIPYHFIMGTSGAGFRLKWRPGRWQSDCGGYLHIYGDEPFGPFLRAIEAIGYECVATVPGKKEEDIQHIISSIDAGIPVLSFGFIEPPECCIIAGYDDGGEVLLGWSYYPGEEDFNTVSTDPTISLWRW